MEEDLDICLSCKVPEKYCLGQCLCIEDRAKLEKRCRSLDKRSKEDKEPCETTVSKRDPCLYCYSQTTCESMNATCNSRERYVTKVGGKDNVTNVSSKTFWLSPRTYNALRRSGIDSIEAIKKCSQADFISMRGLGEKGCFEICCMMHNRFGFDVKKINSMR